MPQVFPDFSEAQDFGPGPEDTYEARIVHVDTFTADTEAKTPMLEVRFELFGQRAKERGVEKRQLTRNYPLRGKGTGFLKSFLKAVSLDEKGFTHTDQLLNKVLLVSTVNETFEGEARMKINKSMRHPSA